MNFITKSVFCYYTGGANGKTAHISGKVPDDDYATNNNYRLKGKDRRVGSQPDYALEQQLQKLFLNLQRTFGKPEALFSGLASENMSEGVLDDLLKAFPPEDVDTQVAILCDDIAEACRHIREIQSAMGYRDHCSKSA